MPASLRTSQSSAADSSLREIALAAADRAATGMELTAALEPWADRFPTFFLPVLRCGEQSGRADQTLRYLERHCGLLVEPARIMRNTWLVPLCILLAGAAASAMIYLVFAPLSVTFGYITRTATFYGTIAVVVAVAHYVPQIRAVVDQLKLVIPMIGPAERELAMNRFFHAMNLLYSTGGRRVEQMIRLAADSAGNAVLRRDLLRAAAVIESGGTIHEAFSAPVMIPFDYKGIILAGDEAGKLDAAFETVCRLTSEGVARHLLAFQKIFFRVVAASVIFSMAGTILSLMAI